VRPALDELVTNAKKKKVDVVLVWRFDWFARLTRNFTTALEEFRHLWIDFISHQEKYRHDLPFGQGILYHRLDNF
jgi:DNA invertase Pin-like site-specific DNA recombinase